MTSSISTTQPSVSTCSSFVNNHKNPEASYGHSHWYSRITDLFKTLGLQVINCFSKKSVTWERKGVQLKSSNVLDAATFLAQQKTHSSFHYIHNFHMGQFKSETKNNLHPILEKVVNEAANKRFVFVPVVSTKGKWFWKTDHITLITVDRQKKEIFYYDSKGNSAKNVPIGKNLSVELITNELRKKLFPNGQNQRVSAYQNLHKHQSDSHNCGMFVLLMMMRTMDLSEDQSIRDLYDSQELNYNYADIEQQRVDFYQNLKPFIDKKNKAKEPPPNAYIWELD